jgi:hypothetical protein
MRTKRFRSLTKGSCHVPHHSQVADLRRDDRRGRVGRLGLHPRPATGQRISEQAFHQLVANSGLSESEAQTMTVHEVLQVKFKDD